MRTARGGMVLSLAAASLASWVAATGQARADDAAVAATAETEHHPHVVYVELFGKGGLWGLGYDYAFAPRVAVGGAASIYAHDGESVVTVSPYAAIYPVGGPRHRGFMQLGAQIVRLDRMSPVPEWSGQHSTGVGAEACMGYELRSRVVFRAFAMATVGKSGQTPWLGVTLGIAL